MRYLLRNIKAIVFILGLFSISCNEAKRTVVEPVNIIIDDISFINKFGESPTSETDAILRIKTHLEYVEKSLRLTDVSNLPYELQTRRRKMLDLLHQYWIAGIFPRNYDYKDQRMPCFIDKNGRICAVGYLIEQTAGRETAEAINGKFQYSYILDMKDRVVDDWIASSGLTKEECAMIQPTYLEGDWGISYGQSYRIDDDFYHTFELFTQSRSYKNDRLAQYNGLALRFDYLKSKNFSGSIRYFKEIFRHASGFIVPVWAISPECFQYDQTVGMNLVPEFELVFGRKFPLVFHLSYGYHIPIIAENKFNAGRHDLTARLAFSLSALNFSSKKNVRQKV